MGPANHQSHFDCVAHNGHAATLHIYYIGLGCTIIIIKPYSKFRFCLIDIKDFLTYSTFYDVKYLPQIIASASLWVLNVPPQNLMTNVCIIY